ncbi:DNA polymerase III subunit gamma and tau [Phytomonospora endophytica]|uniref:DNA polymerase III subunit gamma/tau n=1 Tax=Phytomonospora endophytica TaxID=714109 RepID=A0A841FHP0_9ACTN|nr:DNA polymerase III subunit gamma and tau [Phytomonospora endophytica]MBB6035255.1 DNA polymerase-3 subunit gamma/tau [Phytomonospora endophytica]GIG63997.1 hypothetical protein Pen01_02920 [Phytomonospora endophytica]
MALALYRKYRPQSFGEVIGQEHVTEPLMQALRNDRLNHAYLFSGPRGCGKTTSARILARSVNCAQGPTPEPCGVCDSCVALGPDGNGSVDVIEIDAASHGGVDDARELRERAVFAPVQSKFKVYVIDEAHMVSSAGFNALLKLVEEPPSYVMFIFATTEPDKVLPTIKSRTHHYPFRLIPPAALRDYCQELATREGVQVEPAVYPLVVRAGGGSARDTLSVLDQLIAGAGPEGVTYQRAIGLLGVTDISLIDEMCDALAAVDGAGALQVIDRVVEAGHDPRRFAADLLERLRDLIVLNQVPDAAGSGLIDVPADQLERMTGQALRLGPASLSRMAEIVHDGLLLMRGTTAGRLILELVVAKAILPAVDDSAAGLLQRLDQLERRVADGVVAGGHGGGAGDGYGSSPAVAAGSVSPAQSAKDAAFAAAQAARGGGAPAATPAAPAAPASAPTSPTATSATPTTPPTPPTSSAVGSANGGGAASAANNTPTSAQSPPSQGGHPPASSQAENASHHQPAPSPPVDNSPVVDNQAANPVDKGVDNPVDSAVDSTPQAAQSAPPTPPPTAAPPTSAPAPAAAPVPPPAPATPGRPDAVAVRRSWDAIKDAVKRRKRTVGAYLMEATVRDVDGDTIVLAFKHAFHATAMGSGPSLDIFIEALTEVMGGTWKVRCEVGDPGPQAPRRPATPPPAAAPAPPPVAAAPQAPPQPARPAPATPPAQRESRPAKPASSDDPPWPDEPPPDDFAGDPDQVRRTVAGSDSTPIGTAAERAERLLKSEFGAESI